MKSKVLVTGASGYLGSHCVKQLLDQGYKVRGTVRSLSNEAKVQPLRDLQGAEKNLELVEADLLQPADWFEAVKGCRYVLHVASPWPIVADESVIEVAVSGTLNVLRAVANCPKVRKIVLTSSCAAINDGRDDEDVVFDESYWTDIKNPKVNNYAKSKTLAEQAAWEFWKNCNASADGHKFQLTVLNPTLIIGPLLTNEQGGSVTIIKRFFDGSMPLLPKMNLGMVDVRDCAKAHVLAMKTKEANGERILITTQPSRWHKDLAKALSAQFRPKGYWIPTLEAPTFLVRLYSHVDKQTKSILPRLGFQVQFDNSKAERLIGLDYISAEESVVEMAESMIERGILPRKGPFPKSTNNLQSH